MSDSVFIIIAFYNADELIRPCVASIRKYLKDTDKIVIVNNSTADTKINDFFIHDANVVVINAKPKIGFGKANNIGMRYALKQNASHIVCLNQDTVADMDFVSMLKKCLDDNSAVIAAPVLYEFDDDVVEPFNVRWFYGEVPKLFSDALNGRLADCYFAEKVSGACFMIKSSFIQKYGFFDENYFMYGEDEDLCRRVKNLNFEIVIQPYAKVRHIHSNTNAQGKHKAAKFFWQREAKAIYLLKNIKKPFLKTFVGLYYSYGIEYLSLFFKFSFIQLAKILFVDTKFLCKIPKVYTSYFKEKKYQY